MASKSKLIGQILLGKEMVIKVNQVKGTTVYGYDLITEQFVSEQMGCLMFIPESVIKLLGSERAKIHIVKELYTSRKDMATALDVSERTIYRMLKSNDLTANGIES